MRRKFVFEVLCATLLTACLVFSGTASCSKTSNQTISGKVPEPSKPSAPVSISYTVPAKAAVDESVEVTIKFNTRSDVEELTLTLTGGNGLELVPAEYEIDYGTQPLNSTFSETVTVVPRSEGVLYLNIFVAGTFNGNRMVRTGAVPVKVGSGDIGKMLKKSGQVTSDAEGRKIIIMPARESQN